VLQLQRNVRGSLVRARLKAHFGMTTRCPSEMGECETRTQGAAIAELSPRLRTQDRAAQRGRAARASFRKELLAGRLGREHELEPRTRRFPGGVDELAA